MSQLSLDPVPAPVPRPLVEFLSGVAAYYAFGPKRTAAEDRAAALAGEAMARELAALKPQP